MSWFSSAFVPAADVADAATTVDTTPVDTTQTANENTTATVNENTAPVVNDTKSVVSSSDVSKPSVFPEKDFSRKSIDVLAELEKKLRDKRKMVAYNSLKTLSLEEFTNLLDFWDDVNENVNPSGDNFSSLMHRAVANNQRDKCAALLERGASLNIIGFKTDGTPIQLAVNTNFDDLAEFLIDYEKKRRLITPSKITEQ